MSSMAATISYAAKEFAVYCYFFILITGVIGNFCNILVLTSFKLFRRNQCAFYLIALLISDCLLLIIALPFRIGELAFGYDPTKTSLVWCKFRPMISHALTLISFTAVCLAAIDQYLSTNYQPWLKQLSTLKLAHRSICISIVVWIVYDCIFLFFFEIQPGYGCNVFNVGYSRYYSFFHYITLNGIIPITISSVFSLLAYSNVRRIVRLRTAVVRRKLDKQLTAMVLIKVIILVITVLPSIIFRIYILNITVDPNNSLHIAINQLISNIAYALFYIYPSCTFYLFLMVSPRFRRQVKYTIALGKNFGQRCCNSQRDNQVVPAPAERSDGE